MKTKIYSMLFVSVLALIGITSCSDAYQPGQRLNDLKTYAATLPKTETSSIVNLTNKFLEIYSSAAPEECDQAALFINRFMEQSVDSIYEKHINFLNSESIFLFCENYTEDSAYIIKEDPEVKDFAQAAIKNGYRFMIYEGMGYIEKAVSFPGDNVLKKLTLPLRLYYVQMSKEQKEGFALDAGLSVPPDVLADRIVWCEDYLKKYPDALMKNEVREKMAFLTETIKYGLDNTPAFDYMTGKLTREFNDAYLRIFAKYPDSPAINGIKTFYGKVKDNNFNRVEE